MINENQMNLINSNNKINSNLKNNIYNNNNINQNLVNNLENGYNIPDSLESSMSTKINEKNIALLKDRIKKQENDILYLNNRLKNYDMCVDQITKLNFEINKLNEIINNKNNTIQEFREITDLSKRKIEELINNKKEMIQKINILEKENKKLNNLYENKNIYYNTIERKSNIGNINIEDHNKLKYDLNKIAEENKRLRNQIDEKDDKIKYLNDVIEKLKKENFNFNFSNNINYEKVNDNKLKEPLEKYNNLKRIYQNNKRTYSIQGRSPTPISTNYYSEKYDFIPKNNFFWKECSFRTEPTNAINNPKKNSNNSKRMIHSFHNKYNYLKNKYRVNPLDYSNYLLDNLQENISHHYNLKY